MNAKKIFIGLIAVVVVFVIFVDPIELDDSNNVKNYSDAITESQNNVATLNGIFSVFNEYCKKYYAIDKNKLKHYERLFITSMKTDGMYRRSNEVKNINKDEMRKNGVLKYCVSVHSNVDFLQEIYFKH